MPEYVYALHDFVPENSDEIAFRAGEAIEVVEKDDIYSDGWWQGKNKDGAFGLFPQSYTTTVAPAPPEFIIQPEPIPPAVDVHTPTLLHSLQEEPENISIQGSPNPDAVTNGTNGAEPSQNHEVMKATMTDVQKAIEQLGKNDADGSRSFSFASSRDGDWTDRELDSEGETDGEGETWHTNARQKLAEKARLANQKAADEHNTPPMRVSVPPIEVELSDESEAEDDDDLQPPHSSSPFSRIHPHIPEEEEEEHKRQVQESIDNEPATAVIPEVTPPSPMGGNFPTATADLPFPRQRSESPNSDYIPSADHPTNNGGNGIYLPTPTSPKTFETDIATPTPNGSQDRPSSISLANSAETKYSLTPVHQNIGLPSPIASSLTSIVQTLTPVGSASPLKFPSSLPPDSTTLQPPKAPSSNLPAEWTVEEVVDWLKSKGFDQPICDKFIEQEIAGDVLLDLDVDLLKTEIGIMAFGKRKRIANLIEDLKRPPSILESQTFNTESLFTHTRTPSSAHQSYNTSWFSQANSVLKEPQMPLPTVMSLDSPPHTGDIARTPELSNRRSRTGSDPGSVNGSLVGIIRANSRNSIIGLGINLASKSQKNRPADLAFTPTESFNSKTASSDNVITFGEDDRAVVSENETPRSDNSNTKRRRMFGRSLESASQKDSVKDSSSRNSKEVSSPISPSSILESIEEPGIPPARHRPRRSVDANKASERLSLFGNTFSGSLGKSRKPPPRYSSMTSDTERDNKSEKGSTSGTLSRLYHMGERKTSTKRQPAVDAVLNPKDVPASPGKSKDQKDASDTKSKKDKKEGKRDSKDAKEKKDAKRDSKDSKDRNSKDQPALLRKRTSSGGDLPRAPVAAIAGASGLKPGLSVLEQIGTPDYNGWLHKKGESYNAWKYRYLVLKGPHLYWMRSNNKTETKIKGYLNVSGYKVVPDENIRPGSYGFKMIHDNDKIHYFSSEAQLVVREWMKALMKSTIDRDYTKPVMSTLNIQTIPLAVAQAMSPPPRPPSPGSRAATQKASRPQDPNKLSSRDAQVLLMGIVPNADTRENATRIESFFANDVVPSPIESPTSPRVKAPPRPSREMRRIESTASQSDAIDDGLIEWANSLLPPAYRIVDVTGSICEGLTLLRLAESIRGKPSSPPVPDSAFPTGPNDDKLDGLFRLFDFLLDNDVRIGTVSINDIRQGKRDKILQLLRALRAWDEKRRQIAMSVAIAPFPTGLGVPWASM